MNNFKRKLTIVGLASAMTLTSVNCVNVFADDVNIKFAIWDNLQEQGMKNMAEKFMEENPGITVTVEVTPWDQYWTKLQAEAMSGTLPDVFWMHPEQVYQYARGNIILDMTDSIASSGNVDLSKFPENVVEDFEIDGSQYAIPKDYSTFALAYNKDLFDAAGLAYPDDTWTWDTLKEAAEKLTDKEKGIYGLAVDYNTNDAAYHYIWQNGGDIINEDETASGFDMPETIEAIKYLVDYIDKGYSPTLEDYASTSADQYFESGRVAMKVAGSWMCTEYSSIEDLNYDIAPLPMGKQRADLCGGMGYSASANSAHPEETWKFIEFLAGEEANVIQCESGAAISAYEGTQSAWVEGFAGINAQEFVNAADYGFSSQYCETRNDWVNIEKDYMTQVFSRQLDVEEGCKACAAAINEVLAK